MNDDDYYRHARPKWMVQQEEYYRYLRRERFYNRVRKGIEYGSYLAGLAVLVFFIIAVVNGNLS